ncbi:MAG TPA: sulfite exporter TauE/SafE family protein [Armatimonadota bacterium]|jgi:hypothetical protein
MWGEALRGDWWQAMSVMPASPGAAAHFVVLFVSAMVAGAVNSVAGGGTLLTFPALLWTGRLENVANATSTVALWPGQLSSLWGYRREIGRNHAAIAALAIPSLLGGGVGALLLSHTSNAVFARLVPFLILTATLLFAAQGTLSKLLLSRSSQEPKEYQNLEGSAPAKAVKAPQYRLWTGIALFQLLVAIYGGYFGAGIGILMLAALGFMGFSDVHQMNGLKNINGLLINLVAITIFILARTPPGQGTGPTHDHLVDWPIALLMAAGSTLGGYAGSGIARRMGQQNVRRIVVAIGFGLTLSLLLRHV